MSETLNTAVGDAEKCTGCSDSSVDGACGGVWYKADETIVSNIDVSWSESDSGGMDRVDSVEDG